MEHRFRQGQLCSYVKVIKSFVLPVFSFGKTSSSAAPVPALSASTGGCRFCFCPVQLSDIAVSRPNITHAVVVGVLLLPDVGTI